MTNAGLIQTAFLERSVAIIVALNDASIQLLIRLVLVSYLKFPGDIFLILTGQIIIYFGRALNTIIPKLYDTKKEKNLK